MARARKAARRRTKGPERRRDAIDDIKGAQGHDLSQVDEGGMEDLRLTSDSQIQPKRNGSVRLQVQPTSVGVHPNVGGELGEAKGNEVPVAGEVTREGPECDPERIAGLEEEENKKRFLKMMAHMRQQDEEHQKRMQEAEDRFDKQRQALQEQLNQGQQEVQEQFDRQKRLDSMLASLGHQNGREHECSDIRRRCPPGLKESPKVELRTREKKGVRTGAGIAPKSGAEQKQISPSEKGVRGPVVLELGGLTFE